LLGAVLTGGLLPAAPENDRFVDSIEIEGSSGWCYGDNVGAGADPAEPAHAGFGAENSVWWHWTAAESGRLTFFTHGSGFDTRLALYTGETLAGLNEVGSNDDAGDASFQSLVSVTVEAGALLHIAVDGLEAAGSISLTWYLQTAANTPPPNDRFADRAVLDGERGRLISTSDGASRDLQEPSHAGETGRRSVWWTWKAPAAGAAVIHTGGSTFDTLLAVYTGQALETLEPVAASDGEGVTSYVFFPVAEGVEYQIAVDGLRNASGIILLSWELLRECRTPSMPAGPLPPDGTQGAGETVTLEWGRTVTAPQNVIYGEDGRLDFFEIEDEALLRAADSTVALLLIEDLTDNGDGTYSIPGERFGDNTRLCSDERFASQPNPAWCSGFLVAPDLVATAGHCLTTTSDCASFAFVFGFRMEGPGEPVLTFPRSQVYFCDGILGRELEVDYDWSIARLDRPVLDHEPLEIRREGMIEDEQGLVVIGHPTGWPVKVAGGARVRENFEDAYFVANLDVYVGNSGSPVLNAESLLVEGVLVGGEEDFKPDGNCLRSKVCPDDGCLGELVTRATEFAGLVAASPPPTIYEVRLGRCDGEPPQLDLEVLGETGEKEWTVEGLELGALYCWQVVARRECGQAEGPLWTFSTAARIPEFVRGDADADGSLNVTDAVGILNFLFAAGEPPPCEAAADIDDDGGVNVTDPVALLNFLFAAGAAIPPPAECGVDPTPDSLACEMFERC
jgi:hypothetical protein